ncbi:MAG: hypothetical protein K2X57_19775 [Xanthobacteraceae bacterium]|nr:hypothetical protein [Xanthobacteraceae bacterium]
MLKLVFVASAFLAITSTASEARPFRTTGQAPGCNVTMPCDFSTSQPRQSITRTLQRSEARSTPRVGYVRPDVPPANVASTEIAGGRPSGCPRSFCGCGASLRVFGRIVPELNLAANWLRFPRTAPAPGMVAARHGHVFVLEAHVEGDTWMAYDANSGGHATRIHARSLRGYTVVNPRAA